MRIGVVAFDRGFDSALTTTLDVLRVAEQLRPRIDPGISPIETFVAGVAPSARTAGGLEVPVDHRLDRGGADLDLLIVPALDALDEPGLETAILRPDVRRLLGVIRELADGGGPKLAAACTGTFVLAEAGLLDDREATTSWWLSGLFRRRYPKARLRMDRMVVSSGRIATAGAAFAHIDLAISVVSSVSPALAERTSRHLLIDERPARSAVAALGHLAATDQLAHGFELWVRANLSRSDAIEAAAADLAVSRRTLERHVRERTGMSPAEVIRRIRLEQAAHLRRSTELTMGQIATRVGYSNAVTLGRALRQDS